MHEFPCNIAFNHFMNVFYVGLQALKIRCGAIFSSEFCANDFQWWKIRFFLNTHLCSFKEKCLHDFNAVITTNSSNRIFFVDLQHLNKISWLHFAFDSIDRCNLFKTLWNCLIEFFLEELWLFSFCLTPSWIRFLCENYLH